MPFLLIPLESYPIGNLIVKQVKYIANPRFNLPGISCSYAMMNFGFLPTALFLPKVIDPTDLSVLSAYPDTYVFPENLDTPVSDPSIDQFFESLYIPTDWLTPSTTYLELLRSLAGMFQFVQRYAGISQNDPLFGNGVNLSTRFRNLSASQQTWFSQTVASFGYDPNIINQNSQLRLMLRQASNLWGSRPFLMGGVSF